jgi:hypothetical protein
MGNFFDGFRVKMQPQTTSAVIAKTKITSWSCCGMGVLRRHDTTASTLYDGMRLKSFVIDRATLRYSRQSAAPRLWWAAWPQIAAPAHPRNRHTQVTAVVVADDEAGIVVFLDRPRWGQAASSFAWREKMYIHGFFECFVHFICSYEDDYFTRYDAALIRYH